MVFLKEFVIFDKLQNCYVCRQKETVVFLKELITFNILQNYHMCSTRGNCGIFEGIYQDHTTTKILLMQD